VLQSLKGQEFRPTLGRARESLFGILSPEIEGATVLELFAGSGVLGLEAISRGADSALFVEKSRRAARVISANIERTGYQDRCRLHIGDYRDAGKRVARGESFTLVFADPPYLEGLPDKVMEMVLANDLLADDGLLVLEMHQNEVPSGPPAGLRLLREKKFGATIVWIMRREP
jgi:16S rRNA (guanine(966)-N(2))-methyltransferase RsmD